MTNRGEDGIVVWNGRVRDDTRAGGEIYELVKTRLFIAINIAGVRSDTDRSSFTPPAISIDRHNVYYVYYCILLCINVSCKYCKYIE